MRSADIALNPISNQLNDEIQTEFKQKLTLQIMSIQQKNPNRIDQRPTRLLPVFQHYVKLSV
jgi:hypothetical protein